MRPLDRVPSLKLKLGGLIVLAVVISATVSTLGLQLGIPIWVRPVIAAAIALGVVQVFARGMTAPLRQMVAAAEEMRHGRYDRRIRTTAVDEVGQLATAFNEMAAQLGELDRLRRDLVANAAHELRTPIAGLRATLENVVDGVTPPEPAVVQAVLGQVTRLGTLVEELLDLSRLESGAAPMDLQHVDLDDVVAQAVGDLAGLAEQRRVTVVHRSGAGSRTVRGDPVRLRQVVVNLLANALTHTPEGGEVALHTSQPATGGLRLTVHDTGPGIPREHAGLVFERFHKGDGPRRSGAGAGLGLAICRWIVDLHGGRIHHDPTAPGCRMVVDLPDPPAP